jgi:hypothetical protein
MARGRPPIEPDEDAAQSIDVREIECTTLRHLAADRVHLLSS